ncbi:hypothetical protein [Paenibacillus sp. sgz302251]|uniref:hypothetical protein n=1 Tax=Paenibacillus sp. sgz302251 TaxID=3414493 RepID=UPI003C7CA967
MEKHVDVMKRTIELSEGCLEALEHITVRLNEGAFEETIRLMDDLVNGFYQIEKSLQGFISKLSGHQLEETMNQLRNAIEHVVSSYEQGNRGKALEGIQLNLLPSFKGLNAELEVTFRPYILS